MRGQSSPGSSRSILLVTYYFPPSGGSGVQRMLKFAKYLPHYGWNPLILTVREDAEYPARDPSLWEDVPERTKIVRTPIIEFYSLYRRLVRQDRSAALDISTRREGGGRLRRLLRTLRASLLVPDGRVGWIPHAVRPGTRVATSGAAEAILSSGPPFSANLIGGLIHRRTGLPWVQDFRDPWTRAPFYPERPRWAQHIDERLEAWTVQRATRTLSVNRWIRNDLIERHPRVDPNRLIVLPNGFDEQDFVDLGRSNPRKLTLVHTGSLFANRDPEALRLVLSELCRQENRFADTVELLLVGRIDEEVRAAFRTAPLDRIARIVGYVDHMESLRLLRASHLCLLLVGEERSVRGMLTGKLFEYLGSKTPILAIAPEGEAAELITRCRAGTVIDPGDVESLRRFILGTWRRFMKGDPPVSAADDKAIARFGRKALTGRLAEILGEVTSGASNSWTAGD